MDLASWSQCARLRIPRGVTNDLLLSRRHGVMVNGELTPAANVAEAELIENASGNVNYQHLRLSAVDAERSCSSPTVQCAMRVPALRGKETPWA